MYGLDMDEIEKRIANHISTDHERESFALVREELERATAKFGPMLSPMEGQAIIAEEFDEFTEAVRHEGIVRAREEAIQLAAMAIRFLMDCPEA